MTIMLGKTKCIAMAILFSCIALIFIASAASAQEDKKERGYNGRITIKELLSKFKRGEIVKGYIIDGDDIIKIIRTTRYAIKIKDSIIKDGLDFQKLPKVPLDKIKLPRDWDKEKRDEFIKKRRILGYPAFHNVKNEIQVINSKIQFKKKDVYSVQAESTIFYNVVNFNRTTLSGRAYFSGATLNGGADFSMATFSGGAYFLGATFSGEAGFSEATFIRKAYFSEATFSGGAYFLRATFSGVAGFSEATFSGKADFSGATFHELAYFKESKVNNLLLGSTLFTKYADFREMMIGKLHYKCTSPVIVKGRIDFRNSSISEMHFQDIIFENDVDFSDAILGVPLKNINYMMVVFRFPNFELKNGYVNFRKNDRFDDYFPKFVLERRINFNIKFGIPLSEKPAVVFRYLTFESDAYFIRTEFHSDTAFERIKFKGDANFTDIAFKDFKRGDTKKFSLSYLTFKQLLLSMNDLPDIQHWVREDKDRIRSFADMKDIKTIQTGEENLQPLTKVFNNLEDVFRSKNNLYDANKAYCYKKFVEHEEIRKKITFWQRVWKKTFWRRVWSEIVWCFWGVQCGYATNWIKIVSWCGGFYLFFVILYSTGGKLTKTYQEEEDEFRLRLFVLPIKYLFRESEGDFVPNEYVIDHKKGWGKFIGALKFSMVIFFKIGYIDTKISGKILRIDAKYFVWAEWVIGYWLLTALVVTLSNTLPIVHRLISGIF